MCLALANRRKEALEFVARIRARVPGYDSEDFLSAFRFEPEAEQLLRSAVRQIGF